MQKLRAIELLAPAKDSEYGMAAVDCGADAVYIGAPRFGARYSAGNPVSEIAELVDYAHAFSAKVYVTMNTLLYEDELQEARALSLELSDIGVDALIVQDMAYRMFDLPVPLHASTQSSVRSAQRVRFLQNAGFDRVILERALSLDEMREIRRGSSVELETFVHGAICVGYSGGCNMGQLVSGRSGNRGVCSQPCRSSYNLLTATAEVLLRSKHLLSLKDMMLAEHIPAMIDAGISSFKIEGRLKDLAYLKNNVAYYRKVLDRAIAERADSVCRASFGRVSVPFEPDPNKSFSRGFTDYFINGPAAGVASFDTPKAVGQYLGQVVAVDKTSFRMDTQALPNNGDGLCFIDPSGAVAGTNVNTVSSGRVFPNVMREIVPGMAVFRNYNHRYNAAVTASKPVRKIAAEMMLFFSPTGVLFFAKDETGIGAIVSAEGNFEPVKNRDTMLQKLEQELRQDGGTIFSVETVDFVGEPVFVPVSVAARCRRELLAQLHANRLLFYRRVPAPPLGMVAAEASVMDYEAIWSNSLAKRFYAERAYTPVRPALEIAPDEYTEVEAMRMKYCIRREIGRCIRECGENEPLFLENNGTRFALRFDCRNCEMVIVKQ